jgi:Xaa-Pro aminopeptidase
MGTVACQDHMSASIGVLGNAEVPGARCGYRGGAQKGSSSFRIRAVTHWPLAVGSLAMTTFLFYGDTERSAAMRHELPVAIMDPFLLAVVGGQTHVVVSGIEHDRVAATVPDTVLHDIAGLGFHELLDSGMSAHQVDLELAARGAAAMGIRQAVADPDMPVAVADRLRSDGIDLTLDAGAVAARRRVKSAAELAGIRKAQAAAEAGMRAAAALLRQAVPDTGRLVVHGEVLTAESVRAVLREACREAGAPAPPEVIVASVWQGYGHEPGSGPLPANLPIVIDVWPREEMSACWADMARTFVAGQIPDPVRQQEALVRETLERARAAARPGISGRALHDMVCDMFEAAGHRTQRTGPGDDPDEGFQFSLGHGVGLAVHEAPTIGLMGDDVLAPEMWSPSSPAYGSARPERCDSRTCSW